MPHCGPQPWWRTREPLDVLGHHGPEFRDAPTGAIADAIKSTFGDFAQFQEKFNDAGAKQFGSGWAWLVQGSRRAASDEHAEPGQPAFAGLQPILGNDVWEHAYYLKYQNRRAEYLKAWWNVVNWDEVNKRFAAVKK